MKYFTPDLIARFGSSDERVADKASEEWDQACELYNDYLDSVRSELPKSVRRLLEDFCLHDAKVLTMTFDEKPRHFSIYLQVDGQHAEQDRWLELRYRLLAPPEFRQYSGLERSGKPLQWWLYDEFGLLPDYRYPVFSHSVVFSGGWGIELVFSELSVRRPQWLWTSANPASGSPAEQLGPFLAKIA
jgi:hypothetical protein